MGLAGSWQEKRGDEGSGAGLMGVQAGLWGTWKDSSEDCREHGRAQMFLRVAAVEQPAHWFSLQSSAGPGARSPAYQELSAERSGGQEHGKPQRARTSV